MEGGGGGDRLRKLHVLVAASEGRLGEHFSGGVCGSQAMARSESGPAESWACLDQL